MTPEERAEKLVAAVNRIAGGDEEDHVEGRWIYPHDPANLYSEALDIMRAALAEEREACAKIAVDWASAYMSEDTWGDGRKCGEQIAAAIRGRP